jgi:hypothetical protein
MGSVFVLRQVRTETDLVSKALCLRSFISGVLCNRLSHYPKQKHIIKMDFMVEFQHLGFFADIKLGAGN